MGLLDIFRVGKIKAENDSLKQQLQELHADEYFQVKARLDSMNQEIADNNVLISQKREELSSLTEQCHKTSKQLNTQTIKISRYKELYKSIEHVFDTFISTDIPYINCRLNPYDKKDLEELVPSVSLQFHSLDVKELRKAYKENEKQIDQLMELYKSRYTTKTNKSIYSLVVIALKAELQNVLYNLKYDKLEKSIEDIKTISAKYLKIAAEGNQLIAGTLTKFVGEMEYLFINAVKIEYSYYTKKEQARQEQLALKEQMRQEAEERKALEAEKKKVEKEESKYKAEIEKLQGTLEQTDSDAETQKLRARILELQKQLSDVVVKKEEITNLQNGKAGNVYIISNLGSFGKDVFKIGMTRRLDPQDRINELGSASVPFKFDVHSFIFSEDAVALEKKLHDTLNEKRLNKINLRKEFFKVDISELEELVSSIDPTAEFNKTMLAEEFHQSEELSNN
nr:GIY-YIG nuclease family protein [uncultured Blautia sp.]